MPVALALLAWPLIEIALFVTLGGWLGLWLTLAIVLGTAFGGIALMRWRGMRAFADLRHEVRNMGNPVPVVADQAIYMFAGLLLILPGFLSDMLGLLLILPPVRHLLVALAARRVGLRTGAGGGRAAPRANEDVIDGEYTSVQPDQPPLRGPSGWSKD